MPLFIVISGIILLFILIARFKLNAFIAFITVCIFVGLFQGMELLKIVESIQKGIGDTLGFLVLILGFGAMLGKLVADSGAAQRITSHLISSFGIKNMVRMTVSPQSINEITIRIENLADIIDASSLDNKDLMKLSQQVDLDSLARHLKESASLS